MADTAYTLKSPVMGTFYRASSPGGPALAEVGQEVKESDVLCVIESMKIFTELRSEVSGTVKEILVENEEPVMKNQDIMIIEKK